jgi:hypothetical protein
MSADSCGGLLPVAVRPEAEHKLKHDDERAGSGMVRLRGLSIGIVIASAAVITGVGVPGLIA